MRAAFAVVMDDMDFFPDLSVVEHLDLFAKAHRVTDAESVVDEILTELGLMPHSGQLPGTLSSGQKRRLALASAFVRPRRLLVLDEPEQRLDTAGLDWLAERLQRRRPRVSACSWPATPRSWSRRWPTGWSRSGPGVTPRATAGHARATPDTHG